MNLRTLRNSNISAVMQAIILVKFEAKGLHTQSDFESVCSPEIFNSIHLETTPKMDVPGQSVVKSASCRFANQSRVEKDRRISLSDSTPIVQNT